VSGERCYLLIKHREARLDAMLTFLVWAAAGCGAFFWVLFLFCAAIISVLISGFF
jgi:hypothetical protein